ncbi:hypothetical protein CSC2_13850 [Clostridium zeae]|uniref:B12-binding domain-containing protein n=1 Tax=Clostridium zeae TaxID=2759022 RepID=A0ABQ1E7W1_9CLOT|nr:cobalamin-dependent protein [Clostridium zeae]GFZ30859.1 hypothetical protein CSC2_13850 [Clostridium zeae]
MKLLLVNSIVKKDYCEPVGILFLAAYLRDRGFNVRVYDPQIYGDEDYKGLAKECSEEEYEFVGISVLSSTDISLKLIKEMSDVIRKQLPNTIIGCGGGGASLRYNDLLDLDNIDLVMVGEGELTIVDVAYAINRGYKFEAIPGVVTKSCRTYKKRELIQNLDAIPFMARDTLEERIKELNSDKVRHFEVSIVCGRGCLGGCTFCTNISVAKLCKGDRYRKRSIESLAKEMEMLNSKYGVTRFSFWDDSFIPKGEEGYEKADNILRVFNKLSFKPAFGIQMRIDAIDEQTIDKLQKAGMQNIYIGVENINEEELRVLGKNVSSEEIKNALDILYKYGYSYNSEDPYHIRIGYIAFTPFTSVKKICQNIEFVNEYKIPVDVLNRKLMALYDTPVRKYLDSKGLLVGDFEWKFIDADVEVLYKIVDKITKSYSFWYDSVRYISKIAKHNGIELKWNEINKIEEELTTITRNELNILSSKLLCDKRVFNMLDDIINDAIRKIEQVSIKYSVKQMYDSFIENYEKEVNEYEKIHMYF